MLTTLRLGHYRAYKNAQTIEFAAPDGKSLGLTVFVGPNNSGKTTPISILRRMRTNRPDFVFDSLERHGRSPIASLKFERAGSKSEVKVVPGEGAAYFKKTLKKGGVDSVFRGQELSFMKVVPSRRAWTDKFNVQGRTNAVTFEDQEVERDKTAATNLGQNLREVIRDGKLDEFNEILKSILPNMDSWSTDRIADSDLIVYTPKNGKKHAIGDLGDGFSSVFRLAYTILYMEDGDTLILDEPELSLHPQAQYRLYRLLRKLSEKKQIVVATHSVHFINWADLSDGAKIYRANQNEEGWCELKSVTDETHKTINKIALKDIKNRKLYDALAKEIFFADTAVFVEGQEDVHLIDAYLESLGDEPLPFFGYGSGGGTHIINWVSLARELGVKCAALYDGDASTEAAACEKRFSSDDGVLVLSLPTDDIRDKYTRDGACTTNGKCKETAVIAKAGIFDRQWKIKPDQKAGLDALLDKVRTHLNS